jgi:hypothetical protein
VLAKRLPEVVEVHARPLTVRQVHRDLEQAARWLRAKRDIRAVVLVRPRLVEEADAEVDEQHEGDATLYVDSGYHAMGM